MFQSPQGVRLFSALSHFEFERLESSIGYGIAARNSNACDVIHTGGARLKALPYCTIHNLCMRMHNKNSIITVYACMTLY